MGAQTANIPRGLRAFRISYTNLADAQAPHLITAWQITQGNDNDVPALYRAILQQMADAVRRQILQMASSGTRAVFGFDISKLRPTPAGLAQ